MTGSRFLLTSALLAALTGGIALGAEGDEKKPERPNPEELFKKLDTNADSKLSIEEYTAGREGERAERAKERFKKSDTNNDGALSLEEFKAGFGRGRPEQPKQ